MNELIPSRHFYRCYCAVLQFKRLQHGDRFYYDNAASPGKFTEEQLAEVRKSNLARVHCDNGDKVKLMQPLAFRKPSQM